MTTQEVLQLLGQRLGADSFEYVEPSGDPFILVQPQHWLETCQVLRHELGFDQLHLLSGVDTGAEMSVVCHLFSFQHRSLVNLHVKLDREQPSLPSITHIWPAANWHERETYDLFGIQFPGHPDLRRILLTEDWPGHPLRKDYQLPNDETGEGNPDFMHTAAAVDDLELEIEEQQPVPGQAGTLLVSMGPQHPSTHGVLRLKLVTDGEIVLDADPDLGYLHRCAEKIGERVTYVQHVPYTDRLDYLSAMNNEWVFCRAVEKLAGIAVPTRAEYLRLIVAELNRIASHLVALGAYGMDLGAFTPFVLAFRQREGILDLFEAICGARLTYHYLRIGGVMADAPEGFATQVLKFLDQFDPLIDELNELLSFNQIFIKRSADMGVITAEQAIAWGLTGPMLRASGVDWDLRRDEPYSVYPGLDFKVIVGQGQKGTVGDCWDRYFVRVLEMYESAKLVRQALAKLPEGEVMGKVPRLLKPPAGEVYVRGENPRGELGFYLVSNGGETPLRMRVRAPSYCNLSILHEIVRNMYVADLIAFLGTFDVVMGEVDR